MPRLEWTAQAFQQLESIPETVASEIIQRLDLLEVFPEMGPEISSHYPKLASCRQLIIDRNYRVVYEYSQEIDTVHILAVQHCRRRLPTAGDLRRRLRRES